MESAKGRWVARLMAVLLTIVGLGLAPHAMAQGVPVDQATWKQKAEARVHFAKGKKAFDAKNYDVALTELRASYAIVASPNSRIMIVQTLDAMGRSAEAYGEASAALTEAEKAAAADPKYGKTAEAARKLRDAIRPHVGMLTVKVPPDAQGPVTINGTEFPRGYWNLPVPVMPGTLTVALADEPPKEVILEGGGEGVVDLAPPPPAAPPPVAPPPPVDVEEDEDDSDLGAKGIIGIISMSVGVAMLLNGSVFGVTSDAAYATMELQCPSRRECPARIETERDIGKTYQTLANVFYIGGLLAVSAGVGLLVWDLVEPEDPGGGDRAGDGHDFEITRAELVAGPGSLSIRGSF
jgi:hypothetical protein